MDKPAQIALLIDADNATASRIDVILGELSRLGETNVRRAYGNWTKTGLKSWQEVLHENAIRPVQQFDPSKGKNASDIALAVDAVEILHTQRPDAFALVSSDADFTPLVMHLREHGAHVYGFGDAKTPQPFQSACTRFLVLNRLSSPSGQADAGPETTSADAVSSPADEPAAPASGRRRATAKATSKATETGSGSGATKAAAKGTASAKKTAAKAATSHDQGRGGARPTPRPRSPRRRREPPVPSCAATASSWRCCAARSRARPTTPAGRASARSATTSRTSPRSTRATTATRS